MRRFSEKALIISLMAAVCGGCGGDLLVGSDLLWTARYETGDFTEWTTVPGGQTVVVAPNMLEVSRQHVHAGSFAARLNINAPAGAEHSSASLIRAAGLPTEAYYSSWYYVPESITVGVFWVIMKFRLREVASDPESANELLDMDIMSDPGGGMSLHLYDHRRGGDVPFDGDPDDATIPVATWFHLEAFYRDANDGNGRVTFWLDGRQLVDLQAQTLSPAPWVEWHVTSVGDDLAPATVLLFADDAAISRTRVGPTGRLVP